MEKEVKCPWCVEMTVPEVGLCKREYGDVKERRCSKCGKVIAAYMVKEGDFLMNMRTFKD